MFQVINGDVIKVSTDLWTVCCGCGYQHHLIFNKPCEFQAWAVPREKKKKRKKHAHRK